MPLNKQVFIYSIDTSSFYEEEEQAIHERMLKLYTIRKKLKDNNFVRKNPVEIDLDFWKPTINKIIAQEKEILVELLNKRLEDKTPRELRQDAIKDKNVITLFDSTLTRALGIETNTLSDDLFVLSVYFFQIFNGLVRDGFIYNGEKYIFLTASAGQIRKKMAVFIKESSYKKIEKKLMCGLTVEDINAKGGINPN